MLKTFKCLQKTIEASILAAIRQLNLNLQSNLATFAVQSSGARASNRFQWTTSDYQACVNENRDVIDAVSTDLSDRMHEERNKQKSDHILSSLYLLDPR